ncbi:MAG: hypothetical protein VW397_07895, partial [Candidatus Margulisiibacteriota bacterium]
HHQCILGGGAGGGAVAAAAEAGDAGSFNRHWGEYGLCDAGGGVGAAAAEDVAADAAGDVAAAGAVDVVSVIQFLRCLRRSEWVFLGSRGISKNGGGG